MKLEVYFGSKKIGKLESTENRGVVFSYFEEYLSNSNSQSLSLSLPLSDKEFSQKECLPFFSGLLPEEDSRKKIADYLHISETSSLKLLEALGGECAGMISLLPEDSKIMQKDVYEFSSDFYEELSDNKLCEFIEKMPERPLITADDKLRLSLAGAQEKIALAKIQNKWYLPINGSPSTHILKPARNGTLSTIAQNEYICMKLAKIFGLNVPEVDLLHIADKDIFVVERYDRIKTETTIQRLHQEDFCQALSLMNDRKYQSDGGPSLSDIFSTIQKNLSVPIIENKNFLKSVVFNFLIGNCDSHGKNYSILYKNKKTELSPLYDAVSTTIYSGLTNKLSMKIGKHYEIQKVCRDDFEILATNLGIKSSMIFSIFSDFHKKLQNARIILENDKKIDNEILEKIFEGIMQRCFYN